MIKKIKEIFTKYLAKLVRKGARHIIEEKKNEIPDIENYKFMIDHLKEHYKYQSFRTGQLDEKFMVNQLTNKSFHQIKTLFDSIYKIMMDYRYEYLPGQESQPSEETQLELKYSDQKEEK